MFQKLDLLFLTLHLATLYDILLVSEKLSFMKLGLPSLFNGWRNLPWFIFFGMWFKIFLNCTLIMYMLFLCMYGILNNCSVISIIITHNHWTTGGIRFFFKLKKNYLKNWKIFNNHYRSSKWMKTWYHMYMLPG